MMENSSKKVEDKKEGGEVWFKFCILYSLLVWRTKGVGDYIL